MTDLTEILNWMHNEFPNLEQSFHDGKNEQGKQVTNPTYGFGSFEQTYANGEKKIHFRIGVAETKNGFSIYLLGIRGKLDLPELCQGIGKAKVTGYCISFKKFSDLDTTVLRAVCQMVLDLY
ncbi:MAG: DUF1801 domain-containing protein [Flavobacteriales bacterium]